MIDINTLINNALVAAVQQATAPLIERIAALETKLTDANLFTQVTPSTITLEQMRAVAEAVVEDAISAHCSDYDHDDYDSHVGDDDKHFDGDIEDAVRDALSNMSFDVTIR